MPSIFDLFRKISNTEQRGRIEYILAGLGNPGDKYANTRHNCGFIAIDRIAELHGARICYSKFDALTCEAEFSGKRVLMMKPMTYMNLSGNAVGKAASFYKIPPEHVIVLSDDINLAPGRMRIRKSGSPGGHNGLESIIEMLDSEAFPRIRIGIGQKPEGYDLKDWVLGKLSPEDVEKIEKIAVCCDEAVGMIIEGRADEAMGKFNGMSF
ncbi:MAG: aminoacyl-tRNA hydrolase [Clostridia bacterium]|nr:aminoacyl-tRNA hydrolase [Clostridia bacterium]